MWRSPSPPPQRWPRVPGITQLVSGSYLFLWIPKGWGTRCGILGRHWTEN